MTILGISVGTNRTGVCVIKDGVLLDRNVHNFQVVWSDNKLRIIINRYKRYLRKRKVEAIVVKIPPIRKHTKAVSTLIGRIEALAIEHNCSFNLFTKKDISNLLNLHSTSSLFEYARLVYPELTSYYQKVADGDQRYYKKMFEAILAARIYYERTDKSCLFPS
ncbi:hypothetical protein KXQ82_02040 [Mucilaginibacter sp. HMF5004]|uniref:hypothetical protein n=1 Tax=Mucilaginibacter rivuli TaxID=2857527 RepID=UPI001C5E18B2|nr:hypothetical protein [Mucilaginibacter rivuli]MBW4888471.1 hypothetical protein [Mucilaginibacter rivuli]